MNPHEFREYGRQVVDWIADYMENVEQYPVMSHVRPGEIRAALPASPPVQGEPFDRILEDVNRILLPGVTHWQSPNFFAYYPANNSGPSILGELLSAGVGVQGMLWATSPACTELETHVLDWLVEMLELPSGFLSNTEGGGVIQDSASSATLCALLAARERATRLESSRQGVSGKLTAYASLHAHSSIEKAMNIAGLGSESLRQIETDAKYAMRPDRLEAAIAADEAAGCRPCFVCATVGTTSSGAIDPLPAIGPICRQRGIWMHVDGAMTGTAALCEELRYIHAGLELADSYCFNPHKWMLVNFDCDCFYVARRAELINALGILPEYLDNKTSQAGEVIDYRDWQIPLGRRFRALKLWFVIRSYGVAGLQAMIRRHVDLARQFARWVERHPDFELAAPPGLHLVCFRLCGGDQLNQRLLDRLNHSGKLFLSHTRLDGRFTLCMSVGQARTTAEHLERAWQRIQAESASV